MALYDVAGLNTKIELPVPLIIDLIPTTQTKQRPGIRRQLPGYWVQHETGNPSPGADAKMHNTWLHNGAGGATLSFHFVVDDNVIYQMIPVNEVTWQSADGGGHGNMSGVSSELCIHRGIDKPKSRRNAEALAGGVMKALVMGADRTKRHWDFNFADPGRHHCPDQMMTENYWPTFVANVAKIIEGDAPEPPKPHPWPIDWAPGDVGPGTLGGHPREAFLYRVKATRESPLRQGASSKAPETHPRLKVGEAAVAVGMVTVPTDGGGKASWLIISMPDGTFPRASASAFTPRLPRP